MIRLKFALASIVWFSAAMAVLGDYIRTYIAIERRPKLPGEFYGWIPAIPLWLIPPFLLAGFLTLFGRPRAGLIVGLPSVATTIYFAVLAVQRWLEHRRMIEGYEF